MQSKSSRKFGPADIAREVKSMRGDTPFDAEQVINGMPMLLESAVSYLLSEFDYQANIESNTAIAVRIIAACTAQAQCLQAYCGQLLQTPPVAKARKRPLA